MADRDVRVDQSSTDVESASGGAAAGSGGTGDGQGAGEPDKDDLSSGETDAPEPETTADGPPPMDAESGTELEGLQPGAGGSGGGGSVWDQVGDAYDNAEDAFHDAADDAGDAAGGAYDKVEGGAASLGHDIEHEVAEEWRDATEGGGVFGKGPYAEHQGGLLWDPVDTLATPFRAADRAYDAVEDDVAKAYDDATGGVKDAYRDAEDDVRDAYNDSELADHLPGTDVVNAGVLGVVYGPGVGIAYGAGKMGYYAEWDRKTEDAASDAAGNSAEGEAGTARDLDFGRGAAPVADDGLGRDPSGESADPLAPLDEGAWDATRPVAEQAGEEGAQDAASDLDGLLDDPGPISVPGPGEVDGLELD